MLLYKHNVQTGGALRGPNVGVRSSIGKVTVRWINGRAVKEVDRGPPWYLRLWFQWLATGEN
jgi:hypothetical protein